MAGVEITKIGNKVRFILNEESEKYGYLKISKNIDNIVDICLEKSEKFVLISFSNGNDMMLTTQARTRYLQVDKVAGSTPAHNLDLNNKLDAFLP